MFGSEAGYAGRLHELRTHTTEWLRARRCELVAEQRRLHVEELAVTAVLDERGQVDDALAAVDGVSVRTARDTVETARALEGLPEVAAAAAAGHLSAAQLDAVTRLADAGSDAEWAARAPHTPPQDLQRMARHLAKPTVEDGRARRAARSLGIWWNPRTGMLDGRFSLPDLDGALVEETLNRLIDRMRPVKGQPWETRARRGADALVALCREHTDRADDDQHAVSATPGVRLVVEVPLAGPAHIAGIPLPDAMIDTLRAQALVEPVLVDDHGTPIARGRASAAVPAKILRAVRLRDGHCRWPGCDRRTSLQVHHLIPRSWGGDDTPANLASICAGGSTDHHAQLAPHGPYLLLGNPNQPDGLTLLTRDDLPTLATLAHATAAA